MDILVLIPFSYYERACAIMRAEDYEYEYKFTQNNIVAFIIPEIMTETDEEAIEVVQDIFKDILGNLRIFIL